HRKDRAVHRADAAARPGRGVAHRRGRDRPRAGADVAMVLFLTGLPLLLLGFFTREFTIIGLGSCFAINVIEWGPFCFAVGSVIPRLVEFGSLGLGTMLCAVGCCRVPAAWRNVPRNQPLPPPTPPVAGSG